MAGHASLRRRSFSGLHRQHDAALPLGGRQGDAWDVANAALFLASDEAKYITAAELVVDGGLTATCV